MTVLQQEMANRVGYQMAASDLLRACRDLAVAARRIDEAARAWDPTGDKADPAVDALVESCAGLLAMAASIPGIRSLMAGACAPVEDESEVAGETIAEVQ